MCLRRICRFCFSAHRRRETWQVIKKGNGGTYIIAGPETDVATDEGAAVVDAYAPAEDESTDEEKE